MSDTHTTESAGGVVLNSKREVLVVNQNGDSWSLPKGHIDPGETAVEAAKREIDEESGISNVRMLEELGSYERYKIGLGGTGEDKSELKRIHMFLFEAQEEDIDPKDPNNPEARWVGAGSVVEMLSHPKDAEFFTQIQEKI